MKYTKPMLEISVFETSDVITASEGTMTVGDVTVTGKKDDFAFDYSDLLGF